MAISKGYWIVLTLALGVALASVILALVALFKPAIDPPPFSFSSQKYDPKESVLCAGDTLIYTDTVTVHENHAVQVVRSIWSEDSGITVRFDPNPIWTNLVTNKNPIEESRRFPIPPSLLSGQYRLVVSAQGMDTYGDSYYVPFTIEECGDAK